MVELKLSYTPARLGLYDVEELVAAMCGIDDVTDEFLESDAVENFLYERYEIDSSIFSKIVEDLMPLCVRYKSELTNSIFAGFSDPVKPIAILKTELNKM